VLLNDRRKFNGKELAEGKGLAANSLGGEK
jgi:hypothetical protein